MLFCDPQVFCYSVKSESTLGIILQMYFVAGTDTRKARAMCCRILVTLVVAAVPVASALLMLPLIIATFSGFKLGGRFELKLKVNCFWCLPDSLTFLCDMRRTVITRKGLKYGFCVCMCVCVGGGE